MPNPELQQIADLMARLNVELESTNERLKALAILTETEIRDLKNGQMKLDLEIKNLQFIAKREATAERHLRGY